MKHFIIAIFAYLALVLQAGWVDRFSVNELAPAFLPLVLVLVVFTINGGAAIAWGAVIGLLSDCLSPSAMGVDMLTATLLVFVAQRVLSGKARDPVTPTASAGQFVLTTFLLTESMLLLSAASRIVLTGRTIGAELLFSKTAATACYSSAIGLTFLLAGRMIARLLPGDSRYQPHTTRV